MSMRTIKFRGKRKDNGEWIYGHLCDYMRGQSFCIMPDSYFATTDFGEEDDNGDVVLQTGMAIGEWFTVMPETVGQFTGLLDKNGKEIYEADKLRWVSSNPFSIGEIRTVQVTYVQAQFWCIGSIGVYLAELLSNEKCEVVSS